MRSKIHVLVTNRAYNPLSQNMKRKKAMPIRRTKIIATLGPATDSPDVLRSVLEAGANVLRINMSHGSHDEQAGRAIQVRDIT